MTVAGLDFFQSALPQGGRVGEHRGSTSAVTYDFYPGREQIARPGVGASLEGATGSGPGGLARAVPARIAPTLPDGFGRQEGLGYAARQREAPRMNRQYLYVIIGFIIVIVLAYVFGVFGGLRQATTPATPPPAAGTKTTS